MPRNVILTPFFRADGDADRRIGPEQYLAGFEDEDGDPWGVTVPLETDDVESVVLGRITFSISMEVNGTLMIEAEEGGDAVNEAIATSGPQARLPLDEVALRNRLATALRLVDQALRTAEE